MSEQPKISEIAFLRAFERPAYVVLFAAQMILGLALAIALLIKFYMVVFTPLECMPNEPSLGNLIRCTQSLEMAAHFIFAVAGFRFAAFMFQERPRAILGAVMLGLVGALMLFVSNLTSGPATWASAGLLAVLVASVASVVAGQVLLSRLRKRSDLSE